jgi:hypothetical protein
MTFFQKRDETDEFLELSVAKYRQHSFSAGRRGGHQLLNLVFAAAIACGGAPLDKTLSFERIHDQ